MNKSIKVVITALEASKLSEDELGMYICARLRASRVPIIGMFKYKGVEYGKIMGYDDLSTGDKVFIWEDV